MEGRPTSKGRGEKEGRRGRGGGRGRQGEGGAGEGKEKQGRGGERKGVRFFFSAMATLRGMVWKIYSSVTILVDNSNNVGLLT